MILQGMSKTQEKLGVVEELFTFWNLNDAEATLDELEEVRPRTIPLYAFERPVMLPASRGCLDASRQTC